MKNLIAFMILLIASTTASATNWVKIGKHDDLMSHDREPALAYTFQWNIYDDQDVGIGNVLLPWNHPSSPDITKEHPSGVMTGWKIYEWMMHEAGGSLWVDTDVTVNGAYTKLATNLIKPGQFKVDPNVFFVTPPTHIAPGPTTTGFEQVYWYRLRYNWAKNVCTGQWTYPVGDGGCTEHPLKIDLYDAQISLIGTIFVDQAHLSDSWDIYIHDLVDNEQVYWHSGAAGMFVPAIIGGQVNSEQTECEQADLTNDGTVGGPDWTIFVSHFNTTCS